MATAQRSAASTEPFHFEGVVVRRDADGYGFVEFSMPVALLNETAVFSREVLVNPDVSRRCKANVRVNGIAQPYHAGYRVIRLTPL